MTPTLDVITPVWLQEKKCNSLYYESVHDLEVKAADILNAYVIAPNREKIWAVFGQEIGDDAGKSAITVIAL